MLLYTSYQTQSTIQMYMKIAVGIIPFFFFFYYTIVTIKQTIKHLVSIIMAVLQA